MKKNRDNIYIYLWEELNTVYVGRTVNPKGRHYQHKTRESERTYKFSSEHNIEHPKMIIIENDLSIDEGIEKEKYWIEYYKNNTTYNVLNKSCGGQIGGQLKPLTLTDEEKKERRKTYKKNFYEKHKEEIILKNKLYHEEHKEKERKRAKEYHIAHKEEKKLKYYENHEENKLKNRLAFKKHYQEHLDEMREKYRKRYESHREERLEYLRKYREEHKKELLEKKKAYREAHKEELRLKAKEYREKKKNSQIEKTLQII